MMWRSLVWLTGRRCCFFMMLFQVQTYGSPSTSTATPGFTSLYANIMLGILFKNLCLSNRLFVAFAFGRLGDLTFLKPLADVFQELIENRFVFFQERTSGVVATPHFRFTH